jgi:tetratricopeptide (TPR) repeat protein
MAAQVLAERHDPAQEDLRREIRQRHAALDRQSHHEVLGVALGADRAAVRAAFQRLARRVHPDLHAGTAPGVAAEAQAILIRATEAYQALGGNAAPREAPRPARPVGPSPSLRAPQPRPTPGPPSRPGAASPASRVEASRPAHAPAVEGGVRRWKTTMPSVGDVLRQAEGSLGRGDAEGAINLLHGVIVRAENEDARRVRRLLARAYVQDPRWRRYAVGQLRGLLDERPEDAEALALLGILYHREGLPSRAESMLLRALQIDPSQPDARGGLRRVQKDRERAGASNRPPDRERQGLLARLLERAS